MSAEHRFQVWTAIPVPLALAATFFSIQASPLDVTRLWALIPALFPVFATLLPFALPGVSVRIAISAALFLFCMVTGFSIGFYYLPAAVAELAVTCVLSTRPAVNPN